jgi:acyl-CoA reductase-like NAD-dependent aldehyde dehydrogenase
VFLKTSEFSRLVTPWIQVLLARAGLSKLGAAAAVSADGDIGEAVIRHPAIKKVFFFGSRSSGRRIAEQCIRNFKPFVLEMGGGCSAFVCDDAALETTVSGLVWSSFYAGGQSCVSTERIFVENNLVEQFMTRFLEKTAGFKKELEQSGRIGLYSEAEITRYRSRIEAACKRGGSVLTGGEARPAGDGRFHFDFTVIIESAAKMGSVEEDVFGPLVFLYPTADPEHSLRAASQGQIGLGASIWTRNSRRAQKLAGLIECGMIWINDTSFGLPHLPWGGWGESGWGSLFSRFSLHEATQTKWISAHPGKWAGKRPWWNPYTPLKARCFLQIARRMYD